MIDPEVRVAFAERALVYGGDAHLTLSLTPASRDADVSLVLDVYDLDSPVHPDGHLGWWKFPLEALPETPTVRLRAADGRAVASIEGIEPVDAWQNSAALSSRRFAIAAVLRSNTTNAIVSIDRVSALADLHALEAFRSVVDRDWTRPRYASSPLVPGEGGTIHIVSPSIFPRDAVGNLCLELYRMLRQNRIPVRLHAENCDLAINDIVEPQRLLADHVGAADQILYFYSTYDPLLPRVAAVPCARKSAYFHGITDPVLLRVFDPELSVTCAKAIEALPELAAFDVLAANSHHSAGVLGRALQLPAPGNIRVIPPQLVASSAEPRAGAPQRRNALLSVAQLRPHKKIEDVLRLFAAYRELDASTECWIVGRSPNRAYRDYLAWVEQKELGLPEGAVRWHGSVDEDELMALYRTAGVYVSMSEDEGFCLPLLEAMRNDVPVFAYNVPAVAETLGPAGIRFMTKDFAYLARFLADVRSDRQHVLGIIEAQSARAAEFSSRMSGAAFFELLASDSRLAAKSP